MSVGPPGDPDAAQLRDLAWMTGDPLTIALEVARALETCGIRYIIGGSIASSVAGEPRSTLDVAILVDVLGVPDLLERALESARRTG